MSADIAALESTLAKEKSPPVISAPTAGTSRNQFVRAALRSPHLEKLYRSLHKADELELKKCGRDREMAGGQIKRKTYHSQAPSVRVKQGTTRCPARNIYLNVLDQTLLAGLALGCFDHDCRHQLIPNNLRLDA